MFFVPFVVPLAEVLVQFGLLVGADGADSPVRSALSKKKPKITDFDVQRPMRDTRQWKTYSELPQCTSTSNGSAQVIPNLSQHKPREYEYVYQTQNDSSGKLSAPKLRLWVSEEGLVSGTITQEEEGSWDAQTIDKALQTAYGDNLPAEWRQAIVAQASDPFRIFSCLITMKHSIQYLLLCAAHVTCEL